MVGIYDPACELLPPWRKELYLCTVAPLPSLWPPPPSQTKCTVYTDNEWLWGGGEGVLNCAVVCRPYSAGVLHSVFWPDSEPTKLLHHPKQKWPVKTTLRDWSWKFLCPCLLLSYLFFTFSQPLYFSGISLSSPSSFSLCWTALPVCAKIAFLPATSPTSPDHGAGSHGMRYLNSTNRRSFCLFFNQ